MIIQCKSCSRKFVVKDGDIPKEGRMVECGYCSQKWFQDSVEIKKKKLKLQLKEKSQKRKLKK